MDENLIKQVPPYSIEAEQYLISAMLRSRDAIVAATQIVDAGDFYNTSYGLIFDAIVEEYNKGKNVDIVSLMEALKRREAPEEILNIDFMRTIAGATATTVNADQYAQIISDKAVLRRIIRTCQEMEQMCFADKSPVEDVMDHMEKETLNLLQRRNVEENEPIADTVVRVINTIEMASRSRSTLTGLSTGFIDLDNITCGLQKSDLIILAARPAMGKTAMSLNLMEYITVHSQKSAAIFSLEMPREQLVSRLLAMESRVDSKKLKTGRMDEREWDALVEAGGLISGAKLIIDDTPSISISELRAKCRRYKAENDIQLVIIDYLQLMTGDRKSSQASRQQEVSDISRSLKALARELDVPVIALSQLSRKVEEREDKRPMVSDLRESGAIEQDADIVMFLYRDDYYNKESPDAGITEVIIAKQRNGSIGTVKLAWIPELTRFGNLERQKNAE